MRGCRAGSPARGSDSGRCRWHRRWPASRTADIRALDAWIKARRAAINSTARADAAEHHAERLRAATEAGRRGDSMQECSERPVRPS